LDNNKKSQDKERWIRGAGITLGYNFAAGMLFFTGIGYWLDSKMLTDRTFTLCGLLLGLFYGFYEVWKIVRVSDDD